MPPRRHEEPCTRRAPDSLKCSQQPAVRYFISPCPLCILEASFGRKEKKKRSPRLLVHTPPHTSAPKSRPHEAQPATSPGPAPHGGKGIFQQAISSAARAGWNCPYHADLNPDLPLSAKIKTKVGLSAFTRAKICSTASFNTREAGKAGSLP